ncbi:hypothetical protein SETIT_1G022300v2 [Setaria italica]|uniref:Peroxidase n=1 Tax=Setaria italica TaxID=4555 RepID=K3YYA6_SETIT|nr:peroxidase P7 [Setaria italica]RCV04703.1 hypothetical protein SETIT_1G022300v2 [Setaria italica]
MASSTTGHCLFLVLLLRSSAAYGQLSTSFYDTSCPSLQSIVRSVVSNAIAADRRMGASLVRLFFHDCFVQGCDASILLDDVPGTFVGEKTAFPNANSVRGYDVINNVKAAVEANCTGVVSCADIVALAARDGTVLLNGPTWNVSLGRRDSMTASRDQANSDLPSPFASLSTLIAAFSSKGLSAQDMTALSGAHTVGFAQCQVYRDRIYKDNNINQQFAKLRQSDCPATQGINDTVLAPLDVATQLTFDNAYYGDLLKNKGLLHSDQELYNGGSQDALVKKYGSNSAAFFADYVTAMVKMGNINPLTGTAGQIRANCAVVN